MKAGGKVNSSLFIGEFAELTGVTVKTILHYHKVGLLDEPRRSPGGYRLYGAAHLNHMRSIKYLKSLGLSLGQIKTMIGTQSDPRSMRAVLEALQGELLTQIKTLEERVEKIQNLLNKEPLDIDNGREDPPTFKIVTDILGTEAYHDLPELMEQDRNIYGVLDDFDWGLEHQPIFRQVAEYFQAHPEEYRLFIDYNERFNALMHLPEDVPEVEQLARDCTSVMRSIPVLKEFYLKEGPRASFEPVINEMLSDLLSPAQARFCKLCQQYLDEAAAPGDENKNSSV